MRIVSGLDGLKSLPSGTALSIGNFDGFHRGHQFILRTCRELIGKAGQVALVTFEPHPLTVLRPELAPPRLTPTELKESILDEHGVDYLVVLPPSSEVLNLTAEAFWQIVRDQVRPAYLVEGPEFNFGKGRAGTIERLREWCVGSAVSLREVPPVRVVLGDLRIVHVSSSLIRFLLSYGRARDAAICLGRCYVMQGKVVEGFRRGRTIGMPTANLECPEQLIPADGVYAARCVLDGRVYPTALSIGTMPTFGEHKLQIEAHLIGYDADLYGKTIQVELVDWVRDQVKFASVDDLKVRMARDLQWTAERATFDASRQPAMIE
jgi:riboflavin kinase/FMN adenylyltransferase